MLYILRTKKLGTNVVIIAKSTTTGHCPVAGNYVYLCFEG